MSYMSRHPEARIPALIARKRIAEEECPHWDYDSDGDANCVCCHELQEATEALRRAKKLVREVAP